MVRAEKKFLNQSLRLGRAVFEIFGEKAEELSDLTHGDIHWVYKVRTRNRNLLARVPRSPDWPDSKKLPAVYGLLDGARIPHARLLFRDRTKKFFPCGLEISEYVEGQNGRAAILKKKISFSDFHRRLGALVKRAHSIKLQKFGSLTTGKTSADFLACRFHKLDENLLKFRGQDFTPNLGPKIKLKVSQLFAGAKSKIAPVLVHGDPTPDNCVFTPQGKIVLVDWDNAHGGFWLEDFAWLTYFGSHLSFIGSREKRRLMLYASFLKTHGRGGLSLPQIEKMEKGLHILQAVAMMEYYKFFRGDRVWFQKSRSRLFGLIK